MTQTTFFAVTDKSHTINNPTGLVRRRNADEGGFVDEALQMDLSWIQTSAIVEWKRDALDFQLIEVDEEEAQAIIERFRQKWSSQA